MYEAVMLDLFDDDLETRLQTKAEAANWAAEKRRYFGRIKNNSRSMRLQDQEYFNKGKDQCWFVWMLSPTVKSPIDLTCYERVSSCYTALLEAVKVTRFILKNKSKQSEIQKRLRLLAKCQSALRVAICQCGGPNDRDQVAIFDWLATYTQDNMIYIHSGMKLKAPISPNKSKDLLRGAAALKAATLTR